MQNVYTNYEKKEWKPSGSFIKKRYGQIRLLGGAKGAAGPVVYQGAECTRALSDGKLHEIGLSMLIRLMTW